MILRPLRAERLRRFATRYRPPQSLQIRTCYNKELEQNHQSFWHNYVIENDVIGTDALVLDDSELFTRDWSSILEIYPELVTDQCDENTTTDPANILAEFRDNENNRSINKETRLSEKELFLTLGPRKFQQEMCRRYLKYHVRCIVTHVFVEDKQTLEGEGLLHMYLDDCGSVVRQLREQPEWLDHFECLWLDGSWDEGYFEDAESGPSYLPGGARGPPYGDGDGPYWLRLITQTE